MSDNQTEKALSQPQLCSNDCGFFANVATNGLCSKCYRETQAEEVKTSQAQEAIREAQAAVAIPQPSTEAVTPEKPLEPSVPDASTSTASEASPGACGKGPSRCQQCRKKVGLTGFKCKCGLTFCGQHRYAEAHACSFDYKTTARQQLAENNPLVQASKVQKF